MDVVSGREVLIYIRQGGQKVAKKRWHIVAKYRRSQWEASAKVCWNAADLDGGWLLDIATASMCSSFCKRLWHWPTYWIDHSLSSTAQWIHISLFPLSLIKGIQFLFIVHIQPFQFWHSQFFPSRVLLRQLHLGKDLHLSTALPSPPLYFSFL